MFIRLLVAQTGFTHGKRVTRISYQFLGRLSRSLYIQKAYVYKHFIKQ